MKKRKTSRNPSSWTLTVGPHAPFTIHHPIRLQSIMNASPRTQDAGNNSSPTTRRKIREHEHEHEEEGSCSVLVSVRPKESSSNSSSEDAYVIATIPRKENKGGEDKGCFPAGKSDEKVESSCKLDVILSQGSLITATGEVSMHGVYVTKENQRKRKKCGSSSSAYARCKEKGTLNNVLTMSGAASSSSSSTAEVLHRFREEPSCVPLVEVSPCNPAQLEAAVKGVEALTPSSDALTPSKKSEEKGEMLQDDQGVAASAVPAEISKETREEEKGSSSHGETPAPAGVAHDDKTIIITDPPGITDENKEKKETGEEKPKEGHGDGDEGRKEEGTANTATASGKKKKRKINPQIPKDEEEFVNNLWEMIELKGRVPLRILGQLPRTRDFRGTLGSFLLKHKRYFVYNQNTRTVEINRRKWRPKWPFHPPRAWVKKTASKRDKSKQGKGKGKGDQAKSSDPAERRKQLVARAKALFGH